MSSGGGTLRYLHHQDARQTQQGLPSFTCWETTVLSHWSLWESNYTLSTFFKKFLNDILLRIFIYSCVLFFLISIIPKSGLVLLDGEEEEYLRFWTAVELCIQWVIFQGCDSCWWCTSSLRHREVMLWTPQSPCSWLLSCQRNRCDPCAVECPKAIVWQWHLHKTPGNLKTTVDVARDFHIAILLNTTRGLTL